MKRIASLVVSLALVAAFALPTTAFAAQSEVQIENHTAYGQTVVHGITIDGVDEPVVGERLDDEAVVTTDEGASWNIPVLWVGDDLQLATEAVEGRTYLPVLAFFVPDGYAVEGGMFTVELSESLTKLLGTDEVVSVFVPSTGITYILPASLRDYFAPAQVAPAQRASAAEAELTVDGAPAVEAPSLIDIYCAESARDNFTDEDLTWFIDLVLNRLQPQAINLLIEKFPAFAEAAQNGGIGERIGLYIYYRKGDDDGKPEHSTPESALAYVSRSLVNRDGEYKFCYMIGIDVDDLTKLDPNDDGEKYRNPATGKYVLLRDGESMRTFENTIVHEMFHAFMDDYNRTGMDGRTNIEEGILGPDGNFVSEEQRELFMATSYPRWFKEGSATAVENAYALRSDQLAMIYPKLPSSATLEQRIGILMACYLDNSRKDDSGTIFVVDLQCSELPKYDQDPYTADVSRYAAGYLATLYLSELAARSDASIGSARTAASGEVTYSADKLRLGLNAILERLHNGETLDAVITSISTVESAGGGKVSMYTSTDDFASKFIKGEFKPSEEDPSTGMYAGDMYSIAFVIEFLDYLRGIEFDGDPSAKVNGSILFDFEKNYKSPLDPEKEESSKYYQIVENNGYEPSTVPDSEGLKSGGKSRGGSSAPAEGALVAASADAAGTDAAGENIAAADIALAAKANAAAVGDSADAAADAAADADADADAGAAVDAAAADEAVAAEEPAEDAAAKDAAPTDNAAPDDAPQPEELDPAA